MRPITQTSPKHSKAMLPQRAAVGTSVAVVEPEIPSQERSLIDVIDRASRDPSVDVEKLEKLMSLYERVSARTAEQAYADAMNEAQAEMRPISQDASNNQTKSKYASFNNLDKALRPIYTKHGFALSYDTGDSPENMVRVYCKVSHRSGHTEVHRLDMPADGKGAKGGDVMTKTHATMSAVSYGRRGLLKMIFNIAEGDFDDDGNKAGDTNEPITEEQAETLRDMLARGKIDIEKFCKHMGVEAIPSIKKKDFDKAVIAINTRERMVEHQAAKSEKKDGA